MKISAEKHDYGGIEIGHVSSFHRTITREDGLRFSQFTGDRNPLHVNSDFGKESRFGDNIVHGMLLAGLFSTLVGMYCPGERSLYLSQTAQFRLPLFYGEEVEVRGTVTDKSDAIMIVTLKMEIFRGDDLIVVGEAKVKLAS